MPPVDDFTPKDQQSILLKRFGPTILKGGFACIPKMLLDRQAELRITPTQLGIMLQIWKAWWGPHPHQALAEIARQLHRGVRCIQVNLRKLEHELIDEDGVVIRPGLIITRARFSSRGTPIPNEFDFTPLLELLEYLEQGGDGESGIQGNGESGIQGNGESGIQGNGESGIHHISKESNRKSLLKDNDGYSNLSKGKTSKEGVLDPAQNPPLEIKQEPPTQPGTNGNSSHNNSNHISTQNRNKRNQSEDEWPGGPTRQASRTYLPGQVAIDIETLSCQFNDRVHIKANITQLEGLYARAAEMGMSDYDFERFISQARAKANHAAVHKRNVDGSINRMPYFFRALRADIGEQLALWAEDDRRAAIAAAQEEGGVMP